MSENQHERSSSMARQSRPSPARPHQDDAPRQLLINGLWRDAADGATLPVVNPATEEIIDHVPRAHATDLDAALDAAAGGYAVWRGINAWTRSATLRRAAQLIFDRGEAIAQTLTAEQGKPLEEARAEVRATAEHFDWCADEARRVYGRLVPSHDANVRISVLRQPVGPVAAFTAWNFPALLPARKIAPALAVGCSVILKPAEETPRTALHLGQALMDAGLPAGALNIVTGDPAGIADHLLRSPVIRKVTLTGSVPVGQHLLRLAADDIKQVSMELGGHAPVLVFPDADLDAAAQTIARGKFRNAGQVCISPSRFIIHDRVAEPLVDQVVASVARFRIGRGDEVGVDIGPLTTQRRLDAVIELVADAVEQGAGLLSGGSRPAGLDRGYFFSPTVLTEVTDGMRVMSEEPFGPIAPFTSFAELDEGIALANRTPYGLAGYVFTNDLRTAHLVAEGLEVGMVGVNNLVIATAEAPFGGVKRSGFGREGGSEATDDYTITKYVNTRL